MTLPLVGLAVLTVVAGFVNTPFYPGLEHFLEPSFEGVTQAHPPGSPLVWIIAAVSTLRRAGGHRYRGRHLPRPGWLPAALSESGSPASSACGRPVTGWTSHTTGLSPSRGAGWPGSPHSMSTPKVIDGTVNGVGGLVATIGRSLRPVQSGMVRSYAVLLAAGAVALVVWFVAAGT